MIVVGELLTGPVEVKLDDLYPGFWVRLNRLTALDLAEARAAALQGLEALRRGRGALALYGLDQPDETGARLNTRDPGQMLRIGRLIEEAEVMVRALVAWGGIVTATGEAAPIDRKVLSVVLMDDGISRRLVREVELAARILVQEKNVSGLSPNGSEAGDPTASDPSSAEIAKRRERAAVPAAARAGKSVAPGSRKPPKPPKA